MSHSFADQDTNAATAGAMLGRPLRSPLKTSTEDVLRDGSGDAACRSYPHPPHQQDPYNHRVDPFPPQPYYDPYQRHHPGQNMPPPSPYYHHPSVGGCYGSSSSPPMSFDSNGSSGGTNNSPHRSHNHSQSPPSYLSHPAGYAVMAPPHGYPPHHPPPMMYHPSYGLPPQPSPWGMMVPAPPLITDITPSDVLCGRGGATNSHSGNR